jgi:two-component system response regulator AlgR
MKVLIVDDELPARERLRRLLEDSDEHTVVGEASNGRQALQLVPELQPDVILLDIRMPGLSGMETARHLHTFREPPAVIFTTAYDEYAVEAFDARAVGYVLKPVRRERLVRALEQAERLAVATLQDLGRSPGLAEQRSHVCARIGNELKLIPLHDVHYFLADQKYVRVHHSKGDNLIDDSLKFLEQEFDNRFVRIHRSALVSIAHIEALEKTPDGHMQVRLRGDDAGEHEPLLISRRHLADVRRRLKES